MCSILNTVINFEQNYKFSDTNSKFKCPLSYKNLLKRKIKTKETSRIERESVLLLNTNDLCQVTVIVLSSQHSTVGSDQGIIRQPITSLLFLITLLTHGQ